MIDIVEEADLIQAERYIEDTEDHRSDRDKEKARAMEENLREVQHTMLATMFEDAEIQAEQSEDGFQVKIKPQSIFSLVCRSQQRFLDLNC